MLQKLILNSDNKVNHCVLSIKPIGLVGRELIEAGVKVYSLDIDGKFSVIRSYRKIKEIIKNEKVELIQSWLYHADLVGTLSGWMFRLPVVWNIRSTKFGDKDPWSTKIAIQLCAILSYISPSKIVSGAEASVTQHRKYWYKFQKMQVIPNGFADTYVQPDKQQILDLENSLGIKETDLVIGAIGRYHPIKDYDTLLKAAKKVSRVIPNLKVLIVGRNMDQSNGELHQLLQSEDLLDRVVLVGEQKDVNPFLLMMDAFCLTSISEGFPNVLAEAMLRATPSFSTRCGDAAVILDDEKYLVDIGDHERLATLLISFLSLSTEERALVGRKQRSIILEEFTIERSVEKYENLYTKILNK